jgi:hypothetical protein
MKPRVIHHLTMHDLFKEFDKEATVYYSRYCTAKFNKENITEEIITSVRWFTSNLVHSYTPFYTSLIRPLSSPDERDEDRVRQWERAGEIMLDIEKFLQETKVNHYKGIVDLFGVDPVIGESWPVGLWTVVTNEN